MTNASRIAGTMAAVIVCLPIWAASQSTAAPPKLAAEDQKTLEQFLGKGIVGNPVDDKPIDDAVKTSGLSLGSCDYHVTGGDHKGGSQQWVIDHPKGQPDTSWRATHSHEWVMFLNTPDDGNVYLASEIDYHQGVITKYSPAIPLLVKGMKSGDNHRMKTAIKVFDVKHTDHLEHKGSMNITVTHLGNHQITVPAGKYEAAILKYDFEGKVGPAKVQDTLYRCFAEGVGVVARVEQKNISAAFFYHDTTKMGMVLAGTKETPKKSK